MNRNRATTKRGLSHKNTWISRVSCEHHIGEEQQAKQSGTQMCCSQAEGKDEEQSMTQQLEL